MAKRTKSKPSAPQAQASGPEAGGGEKEAAAAKGGVNIMRKLSTILAVVVLVLYVNTLQNGYVEDDLSVIQQNAYVTQGIAGIPKLMVTPRLEGFGHVDNDNYRPLSLVVFAVEYQLFGFNPTMGHLFNVLWFAGCVIMLFFFVDRLFYGRRTGMAFVAALLFALHPIHTEVVANIKGRDELMCFFFATWALLVFISYVQDGKPWKLVAGALLLTLSYLSKETVICFVAVVPLVFYFYRDEPKKRSHLVLTSTLVITVLFLVVRALVLKGHDSGDIPFLDNPLAKAHLFSERIPTAIMVLGMYLRLLFVPSPLICDYSYNSIPLVGFGNIAVWVSFAAYLFLLGFAVRRLVKKSKDPVAFGILFFLAGIGLFSNIFFLVYSEMAERLVFFASAGFCISVSALLWQLLSNKEQKAPGKLVPRKILFVIVPVSLVFTILTIRRNMDWASNYTLFGADVVKSPDNARLWHSLGYVSFVTEAGEAQDTTERNHFRSEGLADLRKSLSIYPENYKAHLDMGNFFRGLRQYDSAEVQLKAAVKLLPGSSVPVSDLGFVYFCERKYREALKMSEAAWKKDRRDTTIINNMAMCYLQMKNFDSAIIMAKFALKLDSEDKISRQYISIARDSIAKGDTVGK